jgi:DNA-binding MarR family transcriptional regulator
MATSPRPRGQSVARRNQLTRLLAADRDHTSTAAAFHAASITAQGLTGTEQRALDILREAGPLTAGELTTRLGLRPPSVTDLLNRLERKGFTRRTPNPHDARSITIHPIPHPADPSPLEKAWKNALTALTRDFSAAQLDTITAFLTHAAAAQRAVLSG